MAEGEAGASRASSRRRRPAGNAVNTDAVAAYGPTETALLKTIADARAQGKTVRYTTVSTADHAYVFSPRARVYRTTTSLIAHAFHHEYVWPINNVTVSYSGSGVVPVSELPLVKGLHADATIVRMESHAASKVTTQSLAGSPCSECVAIYRNRIPDNKGKAPIAATMDVWQQNRDYTFWTDAAVPRPTAMDSPPAQTKVAATIHSIMADDYYSGYTYSSTYYIAHTVTTPAPQPTCAPGWTCEPPGSGEYYYSGSGSGNGGGPAPTPVPSCLITGIPGVDTALANSAPAASLMKALANLGITPKIVSSTTLPAGVAATYDAATNTITWDQANVDAAVADGQNAAEILFHEEVHAYLNTYFPGIPANTTFTSTIGAYTVTYNDTTNAGGVADDYEHAIVANAVLGAFGNDETGATLEAFGYNVANPTVEDPGVSVATTAGGAAVSAGANTLAAANASNSSTFSTKYAPTISVATAMANNGTTCPSPKPQSIGGRGPDLVGPTTTPTPTTYIKVATSEEEYVP